MFCSICGSAITPTLSYCTRCGTELKPKEKAPENPYGFSPDGLVWAIVSVSVGGLALLTGFMAVMREAQLEAPVMITFLILGFLMLMAANSVFIWMLLQSRKRTTAPPPTILPPARLTTQEIKVEPQVQMLPEPIISVTEHTTRQLDPVQRQERHTQ